MFYFARCMNIIFNSLLAQLVQYDVHTTHKVKSIHAIFYHILLLYFISYIHCEDSTADILSLLAPNSLRSLPRLWKQSRSN